MTEHIETMDSSLICTMSEPQFERLMINRPQLALHGLKKRALHLLSTLSAKFGVIQDGYALIDLPLSHQEIANMLGASREAVSGVMSELAKEGVADPII